MNPRFQRLLFASYVVVFALFISLGYVAKRALSEVEGYVTVLSHDHEVVTALQDIIISLERAESNRRGYVITDNRRYIMNYNEAVRTVQKNLEYLKVLNRNGRYDGTFLDSLESTINLKVENLKISLDLAIEDTTSDSAQVAFTEKGRESMTLIRGTVLDLLNERRNDRSESYRNLAEFSGDVRTLYTVILLLAFVSLGGFALATYYHFRRTGIMEMALRREMYLARQQVQHATSRYQDLKTELEEKSKGRGGEHPG